MISFLKENPAPSSNKNILSINFDISIFKNLLSYPEKIILNPSDFNYFYAMKRIFLLGICSIFMACDDGDLQIETLDFDSVDPQTCETVIVEGSDPIVFFKVNGDEALILELPATALKNEVATDVKSSVAAGGSTAVTYRIFNDNVTKDYFCSQVPLGSPLLTEEIQAQKGDVLITTTTTDDITYTHNIRLSEITLLTGENTRITDLRIDDFGIVTTTKPSE